MDNLNLYNKAIDKWGNESQVDILIEEMSELIFALQKYKRKSDKIPKKERYDNICEEIADVKIMIEQCDILFDKTKINNYYLYKLNRLENKLKI